MSSGATVEKMRRNLSRGAGALLLASLLPWIALAAGPARTVILVRHAERAGGSDASVGINDAGRCRAKLLATMLADANVTGIYTSQIMRTQQTAEPLAQKLGVKPQVVPAEDIEGLAAKLRSSTTEGTLLVVGHSNTIPAIVERLTGKAQSPISDTEYDRMFIVTLIGANEGQVFTLRYPGGPCQP